MNLYLFFLIYLRFCVHAENTNLKIVEEDDYMYLDASPRFAREEETRHSDFPVTTRPCEHLGRTNRSPYIVIILFKTSGSFLGMGCIIDRRTVLTSSHTVAHTSDNTQNLLILAGNRSPWWGEGSQVRKVKRAAVNDYELASLTTEKDFNFNTRVGPIPLMRKLQPDWSLGYGVSMAVFGLALDEHMSPGESVVKSTLYYIATQTIAHPEECNKNYLDLPRHNNRSLHYCLHSNGSFCSGNMGSPVVGLANSDGKAELLGIVIRSDCIVRTKPTAAVNLAWFDHWVRANSLLHFKIQPKPKE